MQSSAHTLQACFRESDVLTRVGGDEFVALLAIASAFVAMTNHRPYQDAVSADEALEELKKKAGTQFDPHLVETFLNMMSPKI